MPAAEGGPGAFSAQAQNAITLCDISARVRRAFAPEQDGNGVTRLRRHWLANLQWALVSLTSPARSASTVVAVAEPAHATFHQRRPCQRSS